MPYVNEIKHDPLVVISRFSGTISEDDFNRWNSELETLQAPLMQSPMRQKMYVLMDVREAQTDFSTVLKQMQSAPDQVPSAGEYNLEFILMFVGDAPMAKLAVELGKRKEFYGGVEIPMFRNIEDALAFIEVDKQSLKQANTEP